MKNIKKNEQGFTLVELIIVIVVITILAAAILVGINPAKRFQQARNSTRWSEANSVLNAVMKYKIDNLGNLPTDSGTPLVGNPISTTAQVLGTDATGCGSICTSVADTDCLDLTIALVNSGYLAEVPIDPNGGTAGNTGYQVTTTGTGGVQVTACGAEDGQTITVQR